MIMSLCCAGNVLGLIPDSLGPLKCSTRHQVWLHSIANHRNVRDLRICMLFQIKKSFLNHSTVTQEYSNYMYFSAASLNRTGRHTMGEPVLCSVDTSSNTNDRLRIWLFRRTNPRVWRVFMGRARRIAVPCGVV